MSLEARRKAVGHPVGNCSTAACLFGRFVARMADSSVFKHVSFCSMLGDRVFEPVFSCCHIFILEFNIWKGRNRKTSLLNKPRHQRVPRSPCGRRRDESCFVLFRSSFDEGNALRVWWKWRRNCICAVTATPNYFRFLFVPLWNEPVCGKQLR